MLCSLEYGVQALSKLGVASERLLLIGGGAQNLAVQKIAATIFEGPIEVPTISEYVAEGATVQAAWALTGTRPNWQPVAQASYQGVANAQLLANYKNALEAAFPSLAL
jgi:xylulokinase